MGKDSRGPLSMQCAVCVVCVCVCVFDHSLFTVDDNWLAK